MAMAGNWISAWSDWRISCKIRSLQSEADMATGIVFA